MKIKILTIAFAALLMASCGKETPEQLIQPEESSYIGTVTVTYEGEPFDNENISINFTPTEDGTSASLTIYRIRFVPKMPLSIDVTIPAVKLERTTDKILLSREQVVPLAGGVEYPRYTVTNLSGEISGNKLTFSLNFGDYPTSFIGKLSSAQ